MLLSPLLPMRTACKACTDAWGQCTRYIIYIQSFVIEKEGLGFEWWGLDWYLSWQGKRNNHVRLSSLCSEPIAHNLLLSLLYVPLLLSPFPPWCPFVLKSSKLLIEKTLPNKLPSSSYRAVQNFPQQLAVIITRMEIKILFVSIQ